MCDDITAGARLQYIDAHHVQGAGACFDQLDVREEAGPRLGRLEGVFVDAQAGRVRYFVVQAGSVQAPRWQALPFCSARLDQRDRTLRVDVDGTQVSPLSRLFRDAMLMSCG